MVTASDANVMVVIPLDIHILLFRIVKDECEEVHKALWGGKKEFQVLEIVLLCRRTSQKSELYAFR